MPASMVEIHRLQEDPAVQIYRIANCLYKRWRQTLLELRYIEPGIWGVIKQNVDFIGEGLSVCLSVCLLTIVLCV